MTEQNCSVTCSKCQTSDTALATDVFAYIADARSRDWFIPEILSNKPILCPTCKAKP